MRLLIDNDVFCKLTVCGLFDEALELLGSNRADCERLASLPYMLRGGRLRQTYGSANSEHILSIAATISILTQAGTFWKDKLVGIPAIDPGEAQLFAAGAEYAAFIFSGDKRAVGALKNIAGFGEATSGRLVTFEAILIAFCDNLGPEVVRQKVQPIMSLDKTIRICFSPENNDPLEALLSYYKSLANEAAPLRLWPPR